MNDKDITQVLQYIVENGSGACDKCPVFPCGKIKDYEDDQCSRFIAENALDLISRQKAEIERLQKEANLVSMQFQDMQERQEESQAEIERLSQKENSLCVKIDFDRNELQEIADKCVKNIEIDINLAKSDAIKDFSKAMIDKINGGQISSADIADFTVDYLRGENND